MQAGISSTNLREMKPETPMKIHLGVLSGVLASVLSSVLSSVLESVLDIPVLLGVTFEHKL